jgi:hypothetical protein
VHAVQGISGTALLLYACRKVPRRAIALLRMTSLSVDGRFWNAALPPAHCFSI